MFPLFYTLSAFILVIKMSNQTVPFTHVLSNNGISEANAKEALAEIQPKQALPVILTRNDKNQLQLPEDMVKAKITDKRIMKGTLFTPEHEQQMFCPKQNSQEQCLAPHEFDDKKPLQCDEEPIPVLRKDEEGPCSRGDGGPTGLRFAIGYKICSDENETNNSSSSEHIDTYRVCYDVEKKSTLYALHIVTSPHLIRTNLLIREREVIYPFFDTNIEINSINTEYVLNREFNVPSHHPKYSSYKVQRLVPDTNMAFAWQRKSTNQNLNTNWQHEKLIPLWDAINARIRTRAINLFKLRFEVQIFTGVFEIRPVSEDDKQMYNFWVNLIITKPPAGGEYKPEGLAVFMNNFIDSSDPRSIAIDEFCTNDKCVASLQDEFKTYGTRGRCCSVLKGGKVQRLFAMRNDLHFSVLNIKHIHTAQPTTPPPAD